MLRHHDKISHNEGDAALPGRGQQQKAGSPGRRVRHLVQVGRSPKGRGLGPVSLLLVRFSRSLPCE